MSVTLSSKNPEQNIHYFLSWLSQELGIYDGKTQGVTNHIIIYDMQMY